MKFVKTQDPAAAAQLVTANLRLVVKIAYEYRRAYKNIMDLIQEGNIGLMQAVKRYDPYRGVKLSSYAAWWIRAYILRFILNNWRLVKLGTTQAQRKLFFNLRKKRAELVAMGIDPTNAEIAKQLNVPESEVAEMDVRLQSSEKSLDAPVGDAEGRVDREGRHDAERWRGARRRSWPTASSRALLKEKLGAFRKTLVGKDKDLAIFDERLVADEPLTLQELGDRFGISRERVRQLEQRLDGQAARVPARRDGGRGRGRVSARRWRRSGRSSSWRRRSATWATSARGPSRRCAAAIASSPRTRDGRAQLLSHLGIAGKPWSASTRTRRSDDVARVVARLAEGERVALVTDAGTPA